MDSKALRVGLGALVLATASVGLAYAAGADLPEKANDNAAEAQTEDHGQGGDVSADRKAGSSEPADGSSSEDVHEVIDDRDEGGCEFGQEVAEAARGDEANEDAGADDACEGNEDGGKPDDLDDRKAAREDEREDRKAARTTGVNRGTDRPGYGERKAGSTRPVDDESEDDAEEEEPDDEEKTKENNGADGSAKSEEASSNSNGKGNDK